MLEQLLFKGGLSNYYPDSGPGSKILLKGDLQAGYFGIVSGSELFARNELSANLGLDTLGTSTSSAGEWFKFAYKGKFLFFAVRQERINITWNDLYNAGAVYGTKDNGVFPVGAGVYQYRPQRKIENGRSWFLVPRLPRVAAADPARSTAPVTDQEDCEWFQLFRRTFTNSGGPTPTWANTPLADIAYVSLFGDWMLNTRFEDVTSAWMVGNGTNGVLQTLTQRAKNTVGTNPFWRPVLELIPVGSVMDPWDPRDQSYGTLPPAITHTYAYTPGLNPVKNPINAWSVKPPFISSYSNVGAVLRGTNVWGSADLGLRAFSVTGDGTNLVNGPRNLTYQSSNLNPFSVSGSTIA